MTSYKFHVFRLRSVASTLMSHPVVVDIILMFFISLILVTEFSYEYGSVLVTFLVNKNPQQSIILQMVPCTAVSGSLNKV